MDNKNRYQNCVKHTEVLSQTSYMTFNLGGKIKNLFCYV